MDGGLVSFTPTYRPPVGGGAANVDGITFASADTYAVDPTGVSDSRVGLQAAADAAIAAGSNELVIPPGTYDLSKYVSFINARNLRVRSPGATITYPSDDAALGADGTAQSTSDARSAFIARYCTNVTFEGITFVGGSNADTGVNVGCGVYSSHSVGTTLRDCGQRLGGSIFAQDAQSPTASTGDSLAVSGGIVTLTNVNFEPGHKDRYITISNATNPANNGRFLITSATASTVTFANAYAITETSSFSWQIDDSDRGALLDHCWSEGARNIVAIGSHSRIVNCRFEQPMTHDLAGTPTAFLKSGSTVTMFDHNAKWTNDHVGRYVKVSNATTPGNNGIFRITAVTYASSYLPGSITYTNASGATESAVFATTRWWIPGGEKVGLGASISVSSGTSTLTSSAPAFTPSDVGKALHLNGVTTHANFGVYQITGYVSSTQVTYVNAGASSEAFTGIWQIDGHDALNGAGSTHAIYVFAGREDVSVTGCTFLGIRRTCIKASGSALPIRNVRISNNFARECGNFVALGADDAQLHEDFVVESNQLMDVATGRSGWTGQLAFEILGSRGLVIRNNKIHYSRPAISSLDDFQTIGGNYAILAKRYVRGYSQPLEQLEIDGNEITSDPWVSPSSLVTIAISVIDAGITTKWGTGGTFTISGTTVTFSTPGNALLTKADVGREIRIFGAGDAGNNGSFVITAVTSATSCTYINASGANGTLGTGTFGVRDFRTHPTTNLHTAGFCRITRNKVHAVGETSYRMDGCVSLDFTGNTWSGQSVGAHFSNCPMPLIAHNREGSKTTYGIYLDDGVAFPTVYGNVSSPTAVSTITSSRAGLNIIDTAGSICDYPLLGVSGRARPTDGKPEIVHAYGGFLVDGDIIFVTGVQYTYKASGPTGNQFNSFAGLMALIDAQSFHDCADYGTGLSGGDVATQHFRTRANAAGAVADNGYYVLVDALNPTALPILANWVAGNTALTGSRGGASTGPIADKTVVWSPTLHSSSTTMLVPANTPARTLLATGSYAENRDTTNTGCCAVLQHNETVGTEEFRWVIS